MSKYLSSILINLFLPGFFLSSFVYLSARDFANSYLNFHLKIQFQMNSNNFYNSMYNNIYVRNNCFLESTVTDIWCRSNSRVKIGKEEEEKTRKSIWRTDRPYGLRRQTINITNHVRDRIYVNVNSYSAKEQSPIWISFHSW